MRISKTLNVSTAHITEEDDNILHAIEQHGHPDLCVASATGGWMIPVPAEVQNDDSGLSLAFWGLINLCKLNECEYLRLDQDELKSDDIESFDW